MIEYKTISKAEIVNLNDYGKDGWIASIYVDGIIVLHREIKRSRGTVKREITTEWKEFRDTYPSKSGIYDDKLAQKYQKLVDDGLHENIMKSLELYKKELEVTGKPICNASTFINQKRWLQDFRVTKSKSDEWMNEFLLPLNPEIIERVRNTAKKWEKDNPTKKMTP